MGAPVLVGAGLGALMSSAQGGNPLQGAVLGGLGGGLTGGFDLGSLGSLGSQGVANTVTPTLGGLTASGATSAIPGSFSATVPTATASGLASSLPATDPTITSSLLSGTGNNVSMALSPNNIGMNGVTSQLNTGATTAGMDLGSGITSNAMNQANMPSFMTSQPTQPVYTGSRGMMDTGGGMYQRGGVSAPIPGAEQGTGGYVFSPEELDDLDTTPITDAVEEESSGIMDTITDTTGLEKKDLTLLGINQASQLGNNRQPQNQPGVTQIARAGDREVKLANPSTTQIQRDQIFPRFYSV
jgi:hypothetical protein